ncbi:sugar transferase [Tsuneonella mangrovi]|uniref:sugar transferase n=1 Tax=Tsuneonella mangrovi TaxID=1982042 RepID=UPI000BA2B72D|nr:sugar transferase [Tsuneonella mangrovi]
MMDAGRPERQATIAVPIASVERRRLRAYIVIMLADVAAMFGAFTLVGIAYLDWQPVRTALAQADLLLPIYLTLALYERAYSLKALENLAFAIRRALIALVLAAILLLTIWFLAKSTADFSRVVSVGGFVLTAAGIVTIRLAMARWVAAKWGGRASNVLLIDAGGPPAKIDHAHRIDAGALGLAPDRDDPHALDRIGQLLLNVDRVIVSCPLSARLDWAFVLRAAGAWGEIVTDQVADLEPIGLSVTPECTALVVSSGPLGLQQRAIKRAFDLALAITLLPLLAVPMIVVAALIKLTDGGSVLFVQQRLGRRNRFFDLYKFRSMKVTASGEDGSVSASRDDARVTWIGRFIRRTSIDEVPQLLNVLRGDMSIVGPRPHALGSHAGEKLFWEVDRAYWQRHALKPGMTGLAQVRGLRGATDAEADLSDRLTADLEYIRGWTIWRDMLIVLRTFRVLLHPRAY